MIYDKILKEYQELEKQIQRLEGIRNSLPDGKLICAANGKRVKWYRSDGHIPVYLPKKERHLAEQLAYKRYVSIRLKNLFNEKKALEAYLKKHDINAYQEEQNYLTSLGIDELISSNFIPISEELQRWMKEPYEKNNKYQEHLIHKGLSGNYVRSKSEVLIDMCLCENNIPFRYECLLQLGDISLYPDFTIRHPITGKIFYWEHLGRMDEPGYSNNACLKLQTYITNGIIPNINLIITCETKEYPLEPRMVKKIIEQYFLS